ncbi:MAG: CRISPR-associated protein Csx20 [Thermodesulfobacteriota bacterium]|nr:CRISPR-associated protein Csx20 [Thermodesulfobacteriota bacterium]
MTATLFLLFNHHLTAEQEEDARKSLGVKEIVRPPDQVQAIWRQIPPDIPTISPFLEPVRQWLTAAAKAGDYVLVQGDFGACYLMVNFAFAAGLVPVYSTTRRQATETVQPDGKIQLTHHFQHQNFRRYEKLSDTGVDK